MAEEEDAQEGLDAGGDGDELEPLAEEMLKMMEEEGDEEDGSQEDVDEEDGSSEYADSMMLKALEGEGTVGGDLAAGGAVSPSVERLMDVPLLVTIELGGADRTLEEVMELGEQSLIELNKTHGDPVDVKVNGQLFARGEVVTVAENFGVRITELMPGGLRMA